MGDSILQIGGLVKCEANSPTLSVADLTEIRTCFTHTLRGCTGLWRGPYCGCRCLQLLGSMSFDTSLCTRNRADFPRIVLRKLRLGKATHYVNITEDFRLAHLG
jgi:hypothetical protein